jgi:ATP-dependent exoDNAse (exonuclease V) alpha subunit
VAIYFLDMQTFSRSHGSSAPSLAAYRSGERIRDERTGRTYDHTARQGVIHKEILLPGRLAGADTSWAKDRPALWNAAEKAETRKNARVAREYLIALPVELTRSRQVDVARNFARELVERYGFAIDVAVHAPRDFRGSDPRNFHAHLLATTREVSSAGLGRKTTLDLNDDRRRELGLGRAVGELCFARQRWAEVANAALESAHVDARIDHRTLAAQGISREPQLRFPRIAFEIERKGGHSYVAERLRESRNARLEARKEVRSEDVARQAVENWRRYRREEVELVERTPSAEDSARKWMENLRAQERSGKREPTAEESAEKWRQYLRDAEKLGEARAAEIQLQRTPVAGTERDCDYDFGL